MSEWANVAEWVPLPEVAVLISDDDGNMSVAQLEHWGEARGCLWNIMCESFPPLSYYRWWQPLPEKP
jgi:hypothetical protein